MVNLPLRNLGFVRIRHALNEHSLLSMEAVFCFLKDFIRVSLKHLGGDLFSAVSRQAVKHHALGVSLSHKLVVHLISLKRSLADLFLPLKPKRRSKSRRRSLPLPSGRARSQTCRRTACRIQQYFRAAYSPRGTPPKSSFRF